MTGIIQKIRDKDLVTLSDSTLLQLFQNDTIFKNKSFANMTIAKYGLFVHNIYKGKISTDQEAIKVVKLMKFNPGMRNGQSIKTKMIIPISFTLK